MPLGPTEPTNSNKSDVAPTGFGLHSIDQPSDVETNKIRSDWKYFIGDKIKQKAISFFELLDLGPSKKHEQQYFEIENDNELSEDAKKIITGVVEWKLWMAANNALVDEYRLPDYPFKEEPKHSYSFSEFEKKIFDKIDEILKEKIEDFSEELLMDFVNKEGSELGNKQTIGANDAKDLFLKQIKENLVFLQKPESTKTYNKSSFLSKRLSIKDLIKIYYLLGSEESLTDKIPSLRPGDAIEIQKKDFKDLKIPRSFVLYCNESGEIDIMVKLKSKDAFGKKPKKITDLNRSGMEKTAKYAVKLTKADKPEIYMDLSVSSYNKIILSWEKTVRRFHREAFISKKLAPNVVENFASHEYIGYNKSGEKVSRIACFSKAAMRGDLLDVITSKKLKKSEKEKITQDLLGALQNIKSQGYVHGDIRLGNVLVSEDEDGKLIAALCDLGLASKQGHRDYPKGTIACFSNRLFDFIDNPSTNVNSKITSEYSDDLFALGVVLFSLYFSKNIIAVEDIYKFDNGVLAGKINTDKLERELERKSSVPENVKELIRFILTKENDIKEYTIENAIDIYKKGLVINQSPPIASDQKKHGGFLGELFKTFCSRQHKQVSSMLPPTPTLPTKKTGTKPDSSNC